MGVGCDSLMTLTAEVGSGCSGRGAELSGPAASTGMGIPGSERSTAVALASTYTLGRY